MDMEKVIENLTDLKERLKWQKDIQGYGIYIDFIDDAIAMLKEQEAKQVNISQTHCGMKYGLCPRCEKQIDTLVNPHYCGNCGQELKWE